jgi:hypothetical protein
MRSVVVATAGVVAVLCGLAGSASADPFTVSPPTTASGPSPFLEGLRRLRRGG